MEDKEAKQWRSLLVPSVQEMVKENNITKVPPRYVQPNQDKTVIDDYDSGFRPEIPVIDMRCLLSETALDSEMEKLDFACREWGFFQLVNHGMEPCFLDKVKAEMQEFFNLPIEEKKKLWQRSDEIEGFGQAFVMSEDQRLDWADIFLITTQPLRFRKSHLFSNLPLPFRDKLEAYSSAVKNIGKILLEKMAKALKIKPEEMEILFDDMGQSMRMNYYPPCPQPDQVIGLTPHSDGAGLTILLQVNEVEGLQIRKDGKWVSVKPLPNAFIVNIGDILEIISNGTYKSIEHRAVVNSKKERLSVATFHNPRVDAEIGPAKSLVDRQNRALFKSVTTKEFFKGLFAQKLKGKSYLDAMRLQGTDLINSKA